MTKKAVKCYSTVYYEIEVDAESDQAAIEYVKDNPPEYEQCIDEVFDKFVIMPKKEMIDKNYLEEK